MDRTRVVRAVQYRLQRLGGALVDRVGRASHRVPADCVALTFDDGPHPDWTPRFLDLLAHHDVRATFFCVGKNARQHPDLVRRIAAAGHAVASHSASHDVRPLQSPRRALRDFDQGRRDVEEALGSPTYLFRPPHGRLGALAAAGCRRRGLRTWLWTVDAADWVPGTASQVLVDRFTRHTHGGDVLLMHDWIEEPVDESAYDRSSLLEALPLVIERLQASRLRFVTLE